MLATLLLLLRAVCVSITARGIERINAKPALAPCCTAQAASIEPTQTSSPCTSLCPQPSSCIAHKATLPAPKQGMRGLHACCSCRRCIARLAAQTCESAQALAKVGMPCSCLATRQQRKQVALLLLLLLLLGLLLLLLLQSQLALSSIQLLKGIACRPSHDNVSEVLWPAAATMLPRGKRGVP